MVLFNPSTIHGQSGSEVLPAQMNGAGQLVISPLTGEASQFGRIGGGPIVKHSAVISADGLIVSGPCIFYGLKVVTAGTNVTVYDNTSASGTSVITAEGTATAGAMITPAGPGVGVLMNNGIFLDLTLGTYIVYYVDEM